MAETSVHKVNSSSSPEGGMGQKYLACGVSLDMRLWQDLPAGTEQETTERDYETAGYAIKGRAELHLGQQVVLIEPGDSWIVPRGAPHRYRILEAFTAVEACHPPSVVHGRDRAAAKPASAPAQEAAPHARSESAASDRQMGSPIKINDQITVGGQPSGEELRTLAEQGFKTIVNLRAADEDNQPLTPAAEAKMAERLGMRYLHLPMARSDMQEHQVHDFRSQLDKLPAPIFVHCASGRRSGAFAMMHVAAEQGMSGAATLQKARQMGFECDNPKFVKNYVDQARPIPSDVSRNFAERL